MRIYLRRRIQDCPLQLQVRVLIPDGSKVPRALAIRQLCACCSASHHEDVRPHLPHLTAHSVGQMHGSMFEMHTCMLSPVAF